MTPLLARGLRNSTAWQKAGLSAAPSAAPALRSTPQLAVGGFTRVNPARLHCSTL